MDEIIEIIDQNQVIPPGTYETELVDINTKEEMTKFGKRKATRFIFKITSGVFQDNVVVKKIFWPKSGVVTSLCALGKFIKTISNTPKFNAKEHIGRKMFAKIVNISVGDRVYSRVDIVIPMDNIPINTPQNNQNTNITKNQPINQQKQDDIDIDSLTV